MSFLGFPPMNLLEVGVLSIMKVSLVNKMLLEARILCEEENLATSTIKKTRYVAEITPWSRGSKSRIHYQMD